MTNTYKLILFLFIATSLQSTATPLAGNYTIGGISPDYATINEAIAALDSNGVSAAVIFNIRDGIYYEGLIINTITGASAANTIIFQSESHDSTAVEINFTTTSTQHSGVFLNLAKYIRFHQLSIHQPPSIYNIAVVFVNRGNYLSITNCIISGAGSQTDHLIQGCSDTGMVIRNCILSGGTDGVYLSANGANAYSMIVEKNHFLNIAYDMLSLNLCYNAIINNNTFDGTSTFTIRGIMLQYCYETQIFDNIITLLNVPLNSCGIQIISSNGIMSNHSKVFNNLISVTAAPFNNIAYALRCSSTKNYDFCFNNISMYGGSSTVNGFAMYIDGSNYGNDSLLILNNIIARFDNNPNSSIIKTDLTGPNVRSDYNLIYSAYGNITPAYSTFAQYQAGTLRDSNSIALDPLFVSTSDLHANATQINNAATPVNYVSADIVGNIRNSTHPTIGAYEVPSAPVAINPIQNISACENTAITLPANFYGTSPLTYQWYKNGSVLLNDTLPTFNIITALIADSGTYQCIATNSLGSDTAAFFVIINALPNTLVTQTNDTLTANLSNAAYQWIDCFNNSAIANATNQIFAPSINGNYAVVVSQNGCADTSNCFNVFVTGIESYIKPLTNDFDIYPNPASGILIIHCKTCYEQPSTIRILDVLGNEVYNSARDISTTMNNLLNIDIKNLSSGIYFVNIGHEVSMFVKK